MKSQCVLDAKWNLSFSMDRKLYLTLFLIQLISAPSAHGNSLSKAENELSKKLLENYNKGIIPTDKMFVNITQFSVERFDVEEDVHVVHLLVWMAMYWTDSGLVWTPNLHNDIKEIPMRDSDIWTPDMSTSDSARTWFKTLWAFENAIVANDGTVKYIPQYYLPFTCIMDMTYWPHDTHSCSLRMRSWVHGAHKLEFQLQVTPTVEAKTKVTSNGELISNNEWDLKQLLISKSTSKYKCCSDPFTDLTFSFLLTRNAPAYNWIAKLPAVGLSMLGILMFVLPPAAVQKMAFGGLCMVFDLLFMQGTTFYVKNNANHAPLILQLVSQQLFLIVLSLIVSAIVFRMSTNPHITGMPSIMKEPVLKIATILLLGNYVEMASGSYKNFSTPMQDDQVELADDSPGALRLRVKNEWLLLGALVDRLALILYLAICIISLIRFSGIL